MTPQQTIVTETVLLNHIGNGFVMYRDEFPGNKQLSKIIEYLIQCKMGFVKNINVEYKENKPL
jgi:hypothetical protein